MAFAIYITGTNTPGKRQMHGKAAVALVEDVGKLEANLKVSYVHVDMPLPGDMAKSYRKDKQGLVPEILADQAWDAENKGLKGTVQEASIQELAKMYRSGNKWRTAYRLLLPTTIEGRVFDPMVTMDKVLGEEGCDVDKEPPPPSSTTKAKRQKVVAAPAATAPAAAAPAAAASPGRSELDTIINGLPDIDDETEEEEDDRWRPTRDVEAELVEALQYGMGKGALDLFILQFPVP
jgi:hypothetical protein